MIASRRWKKTRASAVYWLIDPQQRSVEIYEHGADRMYARCVQVGSGSLRDVPGCPGLTLDVTSMWSKIDALEDH